MVCRILLFCDVGVLFCNGVWVCADVSFVSTVVECGLCLWVGLLSVYDHGHALNCDIDFFTLSHIFSIN